MAARDEDLGPAKPFRLLVNPDEVFDAVKRSGSLQQRGRILRPLDGQRPPGVKQPAFDPCAGWVPPKSKVRVDEDSKEQKISAKFNDRTPKPEPKSYSLTILRQELDRVGVSLSGVKKVYPYTSGVKLIENLQAMASFDQPVSPTEQFGPLRQYVRKDIAKAQIRALQGQMRIDWQAIRAQVDPVKDEIFLTKLAKLMNSGSTKSDGKVFPRWIMRRILDMYPKPNA